MRTISPCVRTPKTRNRLNCNNAVARVSLVFLTSGQQKLIADRAFD